jgi:TonB family protein
MRTFLLISSGILVASILLSGQNSPSDPDTTTATKDSASESEAKHGIYVSGFEILNQGKDPDALRFYPNQVLAGVRSKWYPQIPELQKSTGRKRGITVIEIEIGRDGSLGRVTMIGSAGDDSLDAAASQAISSSAPFPPLPVGYREKALKMRMHFGYDQPASAKAPFCDGPNWGAHAAVYALHHVGNGVTPPKATYSPDPEYSEQARREKYMSVVQISGTVDPQGAFTDLCLAQAAGGELDEAAMEAVKTWKFEPATLGGDPVAVRVNVEVSFRLY